jgi:hypothetical protein
MHHAAIPTAFSALRAQGTRVQLASEFRDGDGRRHCECKNVPSIDTNNPIGHSADPLTLLGNPVDRKADDASSLSDAIVGESLSGSFNEPLRRKQRRKRGRWLLFMGALERSQYRSRYT